MNREEAEYEWVKAHWDHGCTCHISPPCGFCEKGFSLEMEEYLELYAEDATK